MTHADKIQAVLGAVRSATVVIVIASQLAGPKGALALSGGLLELAGIWILYDAVQERPSLPARPVKWLLDLFFNRLSSVGTNVPAQWSSRTPRRDDETAHEAVERLDGDMLLKVIRRESAAR